MSSLQKNLRECIRIMLNLLEKPVVSRKSYRKILVILQLSTIISEKLRHYQDLNKDIQHISKNILTQKLNVFNKLLATKEAIEYHITKKYSCLRKTLQADTIAYFLIPLFQYKGQSHNKYSSTSFCCKYSFKSTSYSIIVRFTH